VAALVSPGRANKRSRVRRAAEPWTAPLLPEEKDLPWSWPVWLAHRVFTICHTPQWVIRRRDPASIMQISFPYEGRLCLERDGLVGERFRRLLTLTCSLPRKPMPCSWPNGKTGSVKGQFLGWGSGCRPSRLEAGHLRCVQALRSEIGGKKEA
jgi:hypothetical protein